MPLLLNQAFKDRSCKSHPFLKALCHEPRKHNMNISSIRKRGFSFILVLAVSPGPAKMPLIEVSPLICYSFFKCITFLISVEVNWYTLLYVQYIYTYVFINRYTDTFYIIQLCRFMYIHFWEMDVMSGCSLNRLLPSYISQPLAEH